MYKETNIELEKYLKIKKNKFKRKQEVKLKAYKILVDKFKKYKIPIENTRSQNPFVLTILQNEFSLPLVPSYWKKHKNFIHTNYYIPPLFVKESNIIEQRESIYSKYNKINKIKYGNKIKSMSINNMLLYNGCKEYTFNCVLDEVYNGTEDFFLKTFKKGKPSDYLIKALNYENNDIKRKFSINLNEKYKKVSTYSEEKHIKKNNDYKNIENINFNYENNKISNCHKNEFCNNYDTETNHNFKNNDYKQNENKFDKIIEKSKKLKN